MRFVGECLPLVPPRPPPPPPPPDLPPGFCRPVCRRPRLLLFCPVLGSEACVDVDLIAPGGLSSCQNSTWRNTEGGLQDRWPCCAEGWCSTLGAGKAPGTRPVLVPLPGVLLGRQSHHSIAKTARLGTIPLMSPTLYTPSSSILRALKFSRAFVKILY
eukprot:2807416-Rhodomonas_salina.2